MDKVFHLQSSQIKSLLPVRIGGCIATDRITVEGRKVGYMYRVEPTRPADSGWRFNAGTESQEYMDNPDNHGIYDVNTIVNYDPEILPLVYSPVGSAFERDPASGKLVPIGKTRPSGFAHRKFRLTNNWVIDLAEPCCVRTEADCMVIWRTGFTLRVTAFRKWLSNREKLLAGIRAQMSPSAQNEQLLREETLIRHSYEATERDAEHDPPEFKCLMSSTLADGHWLLMAMYCDSTAEVELAKGVHMSVQRAHD